MKISYNKSGNYDIENIFKCVLIFFRLWVQNVASKFEANFVYVYVVWISKNYTFFVLWTHNAKVDNIRVGIFNFYHSQQHVWRLTLFDKTMGRQYFTLSLQHYTTYSLHLFWYLPTEGRFHIFMYRFWFEKIDFPYN